jgi:hypothetical protein
MKYEEFVEKIRPLEIDENIKSKILNYIRYAHRKFERAKDAARSLNINDVVDLSIDAGRGLGYGELALFNLDNPELYKYLSNFTDFQYQNLKEIVNIWNERSKEIVG